MSFDVTIDDSDLRGLVLKARVEIPLILRTEMQAFASKVKTLAQFYATPHSGDGHVASMITYRTKPTTYDYTAEVVASAPESIYVEEGRGPGDPPPVDIIAGWAARHGIDTEAAYLIARAIGRNGMEGLHFMRSAGEEAEGLSMAEAQIIGRSVVAALTSARARTRLF